MLNLKPMHSIKFLINYYQFHKKMWKHKIYTNLTAPIVVQKRKLKIISAQNVVEKSKIK